MADTMKALLEGMGQTADEVADFLRGQGVTGARNYMGLCPVSRYLQQALGHWLLVSRTSVFSYQADPDERWTPLPMAVYDFIHRFDRREYGDLVSE